MAQNQMEEVSENISGWLAQHLQNPDVRVVTVVSEGAKQRQRALLNNQIVHITYPHFLDHVYTQALQQMHENPNLGSDYTRIFPVRWINYFFHEGCCLYILSFFSSIVHSFLHAFLPSSLPNSLPSLIHSFIHSFTTSHPRRLESCPSYLNTLIKSLCVCVWSGLQWGWYISVTCRATTSHSSNWQYGIQCCHFLWTL